MAKRFYPAVLERGPKDTFAVWFPDFPDCVGAGKTQEDALHKAENALNYMIDLLAEREMALPPSTPFDQVEIPKGCKLLAILVVGVQPPNPSERVNIYLPKRLIDQADKRAAEMGMSRSSFFGMAVSASLAMPAMMRGFDTGTTSITPIKTAKKKV
jgi:predicted RNase H-like HicB family nuclease